MKDETSTNPQRRGFLSTTLKIIPAAAVTVVGATKPAHALPGAPGSVDALSDLPAQVNDYLPMFFNDEEYAFIKSAADILIPADDLGPGALAAGVPEFIDRQMNTPYGNGQLWYMKGPFHPEIMKSTPTLGYQLNMTPKDIYRSGIAAFGKWCVQHHGKPFPALDPARKNDVMTLLSDGKIEFSDDDVPADMFFSQLWENTKEGFFADPMYGGNRDMAGWQMVGFPGARADFLDWAGKHNAEYPIGPVSIIPKKI